MYIYIYTYLFIYLFIYFYVVYSIYIYIEREREWTHIVADIWTTGQLFQIWGYTWYYVATQGAETLLGFHDFLALSSVPADEAGAGKVSLGAVQRCTAFIGRKVDFLRWFWDSQDEISESWKCCFCKLDHEVVMDSNTHTYTLGNFQDTNVFNFVNVFVWATDTWLNSQGLQPQGFPSTS